MHTIVSLTGKKIETQFKFFFIRFNEYIIAFSVTFIFNSIKYCSKKE